MDMSLSSQVCDNVYEHMLIENFHHLITTKFVTTCEIP